MAKLLYDATHGSDDPAKAALVFRAANGASEAGHEPQVALLGEAVNLMREEVAASTIGLGLGPTSELIATAVSNGTPIHIWGTWATTRGVTDQDLAGKNAKMITPVDLANLMAEADNVLSL